MDKDTVIKVEGLYKKFCRSLKRSMAYGTMDITRNMLNIPYNRGKLRKSEFWSLEDINFEVKRGETFGLVGANGSGKSTLLRLINGIYPPDKGSIQIKGRIGALIAVGAGFHPHMTGRENIYLNGTILGMTKKEIESKMDSIIDFAEIGEFLDAPVSTYSSGMYVRLGFAIAIHGNPNIVLVDEVLAVGDAKFQRKCLDKIREMRNEGVTFILVSHNMQNIESMCSRALLLNKGKQIVLDKPQNIIPIYELMLKNEEYTPASLKEEKVVNSDGNELHLIYKYPDFGTDEIRILKVRLLNSKGVPVSEVNTMEEVSIEIELESKFTKKNIWGWTSFHYINDYNTEEKNFVSLGTRNKMDIEKGKSVVRLKFEKTQVTTGEYKLGIFLFDETFTNPYSQGYYGYFNVLNDIPTMLTAGKGTPLCWAYPELKVIKK